MNEQTNALLRDLAAKLGTTTHKLWVVLLKQAKVEIYKDYVILIASVSFIIATIIIHFYLTKKDLYRDPDYTAIRVTKDSVSMPMFFAGIMCIILVFVIVCVILEIIDNSVNPEYFALKQILNVVK